MAGRVSATKTLLFIAIITPLDLTFASRLRCQKSCQRRLQRLSLFAWASCPNTTLNTLRQQLIKRRLFGLVMTSNSLIMLAKHYRFLLSPAQRQTHFQTSLKAPSVASSLLPPSNNLITWQIVKKSISLNNTVFFTVFLSVVDFVFVVSLFINIR